ncbi:MULTISPECIES: hypothetical protein [unclassified Sporolactobacillus]|uniref:hypothetical protein n=1 Tax=unclassified Sporolactobacillus TaxID=2628533 RepID=UPI0023674FDD|nr:hypothetical protein [Sporolactobacillus sp. CQH2019]MDD9147238.1 hypothetical protein [Sporolactobacillus sp. CQH2019]
MGKMDEQIIVVKRDLLFGAGTSHDLTFQGTEKAPEKVEALEKRMAARYEVMRRGDAEENPAYKQPIPYAVLRRGTRFFTYKRLGGGGESRLHGRISLGVGGHMNRVDKAATFKEVLSDNLRRELGEELEIRNAGQPGLRMIGLINDDAAAVGRVHVGVLIVIDLPASAEITVREREKLEGKWMNQDELAAPEVYERLESWSVYALDALERRNL